jgi:hypothetical protein
VEDALRWATTDEKLDRIAEMLRSIADEEPAMRRKLKRLRESDAYQEPFDTLNPLVSIVIATYTSFDTLRDVALPSALGQTHQNIEVVVVGDAAPPETAEVIEALGDPRVRYENLPMRGPYPEDPFRAWLMSGTPAFNAGLAAARGLWICPAADDDALTPEHVETLLAAAVERRLEMVYSRLRAHLADGSELLIGEFPPRHSQFGLQATLYHGGLRFMELNLSDEIFSVPNDWSLCRRMMRAGVRMGMVDTPTVDFYPSEEWGRRERLQRPEPGPSLDAARAQAAEEELARVSARAADLERQLGVLTSSKSWRLTSPLRAAGRRARGRGSR